MIFLHLLHGNPILQAQEINLVKPLLKDLLHISCFPNYTLEPFDVKGHRHPAFVRHACLPQKTLETPSGKKFSRAKATRHIPIFLFVKIR